MKAVLRRAFIFPFLLIAYFAIFFIFTSLIIVAATAIEYRHHIHHLNWRLLKVLFRFAYRTQLSIMSKDGESPIDYVFITLGFAALNVVFLLSLRWAWNRRADRLNREANEPQALLAIDTGIWPPPPTVSASADTLPRT